jgi:ABC-type transport system involved in multi-copper enzyme maturation permease subunit
MGSMRRMGVVAANTVREAVRDKLLYNLLLFAALMIASGILLAQIQIADDTRIYRDVGLSAIALFGALIAVFVGINLVYREISQRTIYTMLAKPLRRWEFLLGKYLGLVALLALEVAVMSAFFAAVLASKDSELTSGLAWAIGLIWCELALLTAVAIFFSSFTTPYLAAMFTVALWIIGHLLADLRQFGMNAEMPGLRAVTEALYWTLPNLDRLDLKSDAAAGITIETARVAWAALYTALYSGALLFGAMLLFQRRDFR